jgi:predicted esterase
MWSRRHWLSCALALATRSVHAADPPSLTVRELAVPDAGKFGQRCLLLRPARVPVSQPLPTVLLFHGLGETSSEALGIRAWYDRYGLPQAYARLCAPPVQRTRLKERYLSDARLAEINAELAATPFSDVALVCPFTPNVFAKHPSGPFLDRYAEYVEHALLPAVLAASPSWEGALHWGIDGVSLGGYVALEIFLRKARLFGAVGSTQGAFSVALAEVYARRMAEIVAEQGSRAIHLSTSSFDPYRDATLRLAKRLAESGVRATLTNGEGPHDQGFLREAGTLEMLLYQARALHRA